MNSREGFQSGLAGSNQMGMSVSPLGDFALALVVGLISGLQDLLVDMKQLLDELILAILNFYQLPSEGDQGGRQVRRTLFAGLGTAGIGRYVDRENGRKWTRVIRHDDWDGWRKAGWQLAG